MTTAAKSGDAAVAQGVWRSEQRAASTARRAGDPDGMWLATTSISSNRLATRPLRMHGAQI